MEQQLMQMQIDCERQKFCHSSVTEQLDGKIRKSNRDKMSQVKEYFDHSCEQCIIYLLMYLLCYCLIFLWVERFLCSYVV